jgi:hypothetical protein
MIMSSNTATRRLPPPKAVAGHPPIGGIDGKDLARVEVFPWPTSRKKTIDVAATLRMLKRRGSGDLVKRLPSGIVRQRQKLREVCAQLGVEPIYEAEA